MRFFHICLVLIIISLGSLTVSCDIDTTSESDPTVTYNANGATSGSVPVDNNHYGFYDYYRVADNTGNLVFPGYRFMGWGFLKDDYSGKLLPGQSTLYTGGEIVLYAIWRPDSEIIVFDDMVFRLGNWGTQLWGVYGDDVDIVIPSNVSGRNVTIISDHVFANPARINTILIPSTVTNISNDAFSECSNLLTLVIPPSVSLLGSRASSFVVQG